LFWFEVLPFPFPQSSEGRLPPTSFLRSVRSPCLGRAFFDLFFSRTRSVLFSLELPGDHWSDGTSRLSNPPHTQVFNFLFFQPLNHVQKWPPPVPQAFWAPPNGAPHWTFPPPDTAGLKAETPFFPFPGRSACQKTGPLWP